MHVFSPLNWFIFFPQVFRWWLILLLIGWIAFPFIFVVFSRFKDRGYPLSKLFAVFFISYINWSLTWISSRLHIPIFKNNFTSILCGVLFLIAISYLLFKKNQKEIIAFIKKKRNYIIIVEVVFLLIILFFSRVRSMVPEAQFDPMKSGAEKFLNFQVLTSIMKSDTFPPPDGWMAGKALFWTYDEVEKKKKDTDGKIITEKVKKDHPRTFYINYYYFGHLMMGTFGKLSGYPSEYVFNLGLATLLAFSAIGAFSLAFNLGGNLMLAFFGLLAVAFFGNFDATVQYLEKLGMGVRGDDAFWGVDFWRSSRMFKGTITEFPFFSIILGDFHAHNLNIPNFIFLLSLLLNLTFRKPDWQIDFDEKIKIRNIVRQYGLLFLLIGVYWGVCYLTNSWDVINCSFLIGFFLLYFYYYPADFKSQRILFLRMILTCVAVGIIMFLTIMFFQIYFEKPIDTEGFPFKWLPQNLRTKLPYYISHHLFFLIPTIIYLIIIMKEKLFFNQSENKTIYERFIKAILIALLVIAVALFNWLGYWMPSIALTLSLFCILMVFIRENHRIEAAAFIFLSVSFFVSFACDVWYLDDRYSGELERYNTVFKFYYPIWTLFAMASVVAFRFLFKWAKERKGKILYALMCLIFAAVVVFGMHYPLASTIVRTSQFERNAEGKLIFRPIRGIWKDRMEESRPPLTLNSIEYIGELDKFKDDYEVIKYIKQNIKDRPVVLEVQPKEGSGAYSPVSRIATTTGLRTIIGWSHHEAQHRGGRAYAEIGPREQDVEKIYKSEEWDNIKPILDKYEVKYIFVGALEREFFPPESLSKFEQNCKEVFKSNDSVLYEYK